MLFCERERRSSSDRLWRTWSWFWLWAGVATWACTSSTPWLHPPRGFASLSPISPTLRLPCPQISAQLKASRWTFDLASVSLPSLSSWDRSVLSIPAWPCLCLGNALKELRKRFLRNDANIPSFCSQLHRPATYLLEKPCSEPQCIRQHKEKKKPNQMIVEVFQMY
jgi:hypothetical protein